MIPLTKHKIVLIFLKNYSRTGMGLKFSGLVHFINTNRCYKLEKNLSTFKTDLAELGWNDPTAKNEVFIGL